MKQKCLSILTIIQLLFGPLIHTASYLHIAWGDNIYHAIYFKSSNNGNYDYSDYNCFFRFAFAIFTFTAIIRSPNQCKVWNDMNKNQNHNTKKGFWVEKTNLLQLKRLQQFKMIQLMTKVFIKTKRTREIVCTPPPPFCWGGQKGGLDRNLIFRGRLVRIRGVT